MTAAPDDGSDSLVSPNVLLIIDRQQPLVSNKFEGFVSIKRMCGKRY